MALAATAATGVVLFYGFFELALAIPLPGRWYVPGVAVLWAAVALAVIVAGRNRWRPLVLVGAVTTLLVIVLLLVPWTSRKRFVRHLNQVEPGMTRQEAREVMLPYHPVGTGEATPDSADSYRHDQQKARYNSDVGLVYFEEGRVVRVAFLPD